MASPPIKVLLSFFDTSFSHQPPPINDTTLGSVRRTQWRWINNAWKPAFSRCPIHIKCSIGGSCYHFHETYQPWDWCQAFPIASLSIAVLADMFIWKMNRKEIREYCNDKIADNPTNNPLESVPCNPSERQNLPSLSLEVWPCHALWPDTTLEITLPVFSLQPLSI